MLKAHKIGIKNLLPESISSILSLLICFSFIMSGCSLKVKKDTCYAFETDKIPTSMKIALVLPLNTKLGKEALLAVRCGMEDFFTKKDASLFIINNFGTKEGSIKAAAIANNIGVDIVLGPISTTNTRVLMKKIRKSTTVISYANCGADISLGFDITEQIKKLPLSGYKNILLVFPARAFEFAKNFDFFDVGQNVEKAFIEDVKDKDFVKMLNRWAVPTLEEDLEEERLAKEKASVKEDALSPNNIEASYLKDGESVIEEETSKEDEYLGAVVLIGVANPRVVVDSVLYYGVNIAGMRNKKRTVTALMGSSMWLDRLANFDNKFVNGVFTSTIKQTPYKLEKKFASIGLKSSYTSRLCYSSIELLASIPASKVKDIKRFIYSKKKFNLSAGKLVSDKKYLHWQYNNYRIKISKKSNHRKGLVLV